jgi:hypothetical protein
VIERSTDACHVLSQTIIEEIVMKLNSKSGATLAAAAATLFLAGAVVSTGSTNANAAAQGKCMGVNACKGQSACKGSANACKGQNACKGTGFSMSSEKACAAMGAKFVKG